MAARQVDPHFRRTLQEARLVLVVLGVVTFVVLSICYSMGYRPETGLRAHQAGVIHLQLLESTVAPPAGELRHVEIILPAPPEGTTGPPAPVDYAIPAGFEVKVRDGQAIGVNSLLAGPVVDLSKISMVWGLPSWVFWGILVPKAVCVALTFWFALAFARDHDWAAGPDSAGGGG